jgi:hypothetical protein
MAGPTSDFHHGDMDIREQAATFNAVMTASKWGSLTIVVGVLFFTLWLCTAAGFVSALAAAVVVAALGVFFLRSKPSAH